MFVLETKSSLELNDGKRMSYLQRNVLLGCFVLSLISWMRKKPHSVIAASQAMFSQGVRASPLLASTPQHEAIQIYFTPSGSSMPWMRQEIGLLYKDPWGQYYQNTDQDYTLQKSFGPPSGLRAMPKHVWIHMQGYEAWMQYTWLTTSALAALALATYADQQLNAKSYYAPVWNDSMLPPKSFFALHNSSFYNAFHAPGREFASAAQSARKNTK